MEESRIQQQLTIATVFVDTFQTLLVHPKDAIATLRATARCLEFLLDNPAELQKNFSNKMLELLKEENLLVNCSSIRH